MIRHARTDDLPVLREVERAAGEPFRELGMDAVADDDPPSIAALAAFRRTGGALVLTDHGDAPVAYLLVEPLDGYAHIEQVSVHPRHARQGLGRRLVDAATGWAGRCDLAGLTLTTYAAVPWNAPYYRRLGFREFTDAELPAGLRALRAREAARGLDAWPRVAMFRSLVDDARR